MDDCITFGSFTLDLRRRLLSRAGAPVPLGSRALEVLCLLAARPGELVGKDELLARAWAGSVVEDNNLQVQVSALRRALAADPGGRDWLRTVPARGYRFVAPVQALQDGASAAAPAQQVRFVRALDGVHLAAACSATAGPPLLRTGLWLTHLEQEWRTPPWGPLNRQLAAACTLLRYDQRGTGLSDRDVPPLAFGQLVDDLASVAAALAPPRCAVLGISQGVPVAIDYAARHPERVACLVLWGGYAQGWRRRGDPSLVARGEAFRTLARLGWGQDNPAFRQLFTSLAMPGAGREEMDAFNTLQRLSASAEVAAAVVDLTGDVDVSDRLAGLRVPTLVLHSERDAWVPLAQGRALAQAIPGAEFLPLDSASHVLMPSEPAWAGAVDALLAFVRRHAGS